MDSKECVEYVEAVLSYGPVSQWKKIVDFVDNLKKNGSLDFIAQKLLAADALFSLFDRNKAKKLMSTIESEIKANKKLIKGESEEYFLFEALNAWMVAGDYKSAFDAILQGLKKFPRNLFFCKRAQLMCLLGGMNSDILKPALLIQSENEGHQYYDGMLVFGYEQANRFVEAEQAALIAFKAGYQDGWLDHGYAHSLYFQGVSRIPEALSFLKTKSIHWNLNIMMPFIYTHLWWHYALVLLESGDIHQALNIFDKYLWPKDNPELCKDVQVQINALELLWKIEALDKHDLIKNRWKTVIDVCKKRLTEHADLLHDVLMLRGINLLNDNKSFDKLVKSINKDVDKSDFNNIIKACSHIFQAKSEEEGKRGREELQSLHKVWPVVGNSTEQRAVFLELAYNEPVVCGQVKSVSQI